MLTQTEALQEVKKKKGLITCCTVGLCLEVELWLLDFFLVSMKHLTVHSGRFLIQLVRDSQMFPPGWFHFSPD